MSLKRVHFKWPLEEASTTTETDFDISSFPRSRGYSVPSNFSSKGVLGSRIRPFDPRRREDRSPEDDSLITKSLTLPAPYDRTSPEDGRLTQSCSAASPQSFKYNKNVRRDLAPRRYAPTMSPKMERTSKMPASPMESPKSPIMTKRPYVKDTSVIVRPRSLKHKHQRDVDPFPGGPNSLHCRDRMPPTTLDLNNVYDDDDDEENYYGGKRNAEDEPSAAKKCATDPLLADLLMASNTDRNFSSSNGARQSVPGGVEYTQISPRVIALTYPTNGSDAAYRHSIKEISEKLRRSYPERYKIFNVSQKRSDLGRANAGAVVELGWPDQLAPPLDRLCSICKQIENWLNSQPENLVVIHCKGWRSRAAIVVAAYMHYTNICAGDETVADRFSMQIFSEKFLGVDGQPSHKRYVRYFANLLSGKTKVNPAPIFLTSILLTKLAGKGIIVKIYERMKPVYSSQPVSTKSNATIDVDNGLSLRGDVLVKCFERRSNEDRTLLFQCQFNTCALDLSSSAPNVYFYKEELDLITEGRSIDNQAGIEFRFVFEPPKQSKRSRSVSSRRSLNLSRGESKERDIGGEFSRADSYENFDRPEDDRSISSSIDPPHLTGAAPTSPLYAELLKTPNGTGILPSSAQASPLDGADSGIGSDSPKHTMVPPQVPPKPQTPAFGGDDPMRSAYEDSTLGRDRSVLPAAVRPPSRTGKSLASLGAAAASAAANNVPDSTRPISPAESTATHRSTSRIEPDLVAKDRYDPSSKCFSYVPAKALKEHYTTPKKPPPSLRRASMERSNLDIPSVVDHDSLRQISITPSELSRRAETPTWDSVVDKIAPKVELPEVRKHFSEIERERYNNGNTDYFSKTLPNGYSEHNYDDNEYEKPVVVNQARQATQTPTLLGRRSEGPARRRRFDSYGGAHDDYASDMDDFCDPDFYLSYTTSQPPVQDRYGAGSKSVELPRKPVKAISQRELDEIDSIIESTAALPPRACYTPKPTPPSDRDAFRLRNCRSVSSAPRKLFSNERYDATADADNPDDWLKHKLRTLHSKRSGRPDAIARKNTERILLEELKNVNTDRTPQRDEYVSEGYGQRPSSTTPAVSGSDALSLDPLEEYQREEARLHNTRSPFTAIDDFRAANRAAADTPNSLASSSLRFGRGATPTLQAMRAKPPTPPPREVRSPQPTPQSGRRSANQTPSVYQQERARLAANDYLSDDDDDATSEFSQNLRSLVQDSQFTKHEPTTGYGTATKSILKRRSANYDDNVYDSKSDISASPRDNFQDSRAGGSSHYAAGGSASSTPLPSGNRAETPAFPVTTRETPLPFHPLLYQGAAGASNGSQQPSNIITTRSSSPRSMYYGQQSRRSSMTSIEGGDVIHHHPVFVKDTSKYWYKPAISREDAIAMLREKPPGTFVVRDSNSFPGAFGLALKVAKPPEGVPLGDGNELVRHFLIEPSPKGVKLKGCNNEPVFGTLAALVYQHSITPMALPCRLLLPEYDPASSPEHLSAAQALLEQGAACNVTYIYSFDTESLTGPEAVRRAVTESYANYNRGTARAVNVHFKVSAQGITLTDNTRTLFFRRHYPVNSVIFAGVDPEERKWDNNTVGQLPPTYVRQARVFGFVARKISSRADNACHVFAELDPEQPASAVVNFITKVMMGQNQTNRAKTPLS